MSLFLLTVLVVSGSPDGGIKESAPPPSVRSGRELFDAAHSALRQWAKPSEQELDAAARELLGIYCEIKQDTQMARSQRETLRTTVRNRLDQLSTQLSKRIAKEKAAAKAATGKPANVKSVAADKSRPRNVALAQIGVQPGGGGGGFGGGQNGNGAGGGQNGNAVPDNGQQLVDLIQNTISPKSWEVNGGSCTIYYWQPQHAIVVRGTDDVHGQISDALEQLNRAGH